MSDELTKSEPAQDGGYLTKKEVATMLKIGTRTVESWVARGMLPGLRIGRTLRFERETVQKFLRVNCTVGTRPELN